MEEIINFLGFGGRGTEYVLSKNVTKEIPPLFINNDNKFVFSVTRMCNKYTGMLHNDNVVPIKITDETGNQVYDTKDTLLSDGINFYKRILQPTGWELIPELILYTPKTKKHE